MKLTPRELIIIGMAVAVMLLFWIFRPIESITEKDDYKTKFENLELKYDSAMVRSKQDSAIAKNLMIQVEERNLMMKTMVAERNARSRVNYNSRNNEIEKMRNDSVDEVVVDSAIVAMLDSIRNRAIKR